MNCVMAVALAGKTLNIGQFNIFPFLETAQFLLDIIITESLEQFSGLTYSLLPLDSVIPQCSFKVRVRYANLALTGGPTLSGAVMGSSMSSKMSASESHSLTD